MVKNKHHGLLKMRMHCAVLSFLFGISAYAQTPDTIKVLFIGNSYVYYNNLPSLFSQLAEAGGKTAIVNSSAIGSYRLIDHRNNSVSLSLIAQEQWNVVVLQEQSVLPVIQYLRETMMYPASRFLDSLIRKQGAATMFYMTWGRKYGGIFSVSGYSTPLFQDFHHMQDSLTFAYREVAAKLHARISPVGIAWKNALQEDPSVDLWISDNSHPTLKGSYLAACTFYTAIFNASPVGLTYTAGLNPADAAFLQKHAAATLTSIALSNNAMPLSFHLAQNYPNPFNPSTTIRYALPSSAYVKLTIHDLLGREIATLVNEEQSAGWKEVQWNTKNCASGIYYYSFTALPIGGMRIGVFRETKKMILIR